MKFTKKITNEAYKKLSEADKKEYAKFLKELKAKEESEIEEVEEEIDEEVEEEVEEEAKSPRIKVTRNASVTSQRIVIPKEGTYEFASIEVVESDSRPNQKTGKKVVVFTVSGTVNGKPMQFATIDSGFIESLLVHSEVNDTDAARIQFVPIEGSRYFDYRLA